MTAQSNPWHRALLPKYLSYMVLIVSILYGFFFLLTALNMGALFRGSSGQIAFQAAAIVILPLAQLVSIIRRHYAASLILAVIGYGVFILWVS